jgi:hypothetical protein
MIQPDKRILGIALAAVAAVACTTPRVFVSRDQPHATLRVTTGRAGQGIYPARIVKVDGQAAFGDRTSYWIRPGKHVLRVSADFESMRKSEVTSLPQRTAQPRNLVKSLTVNVEAGKRYYIGARYKGPTVLDWEPIVVNVEPEGGG